MNKKKTEEISDADKRRGEQLPTPAVCICVLLLRQQK